jgi:hypothetical protein
MGVSRTYAQVSTLNLRSLEVCAMGSDNKASKEPLYQRLFTLTWETTFKWLIGLIGLSLAALVTRLSQHKMPSAITHPAEYWLGVISMFFGSLAGIFVILTAAVRAPIAFRRWRHPPHLNLVALGGRCATVEVWHSGNPAIWEARMRITKFSGNVFNPNPANPDPLLHRCYFKKDGELHKELRLTDGETASIVLAERKRSGPHSRLREIWTEVPNADNERGTRLLGDTIIEIIFNTKPTQKNFQIKRCFQVSYKSGVMECLEVSRG